MKKTIVKLKSLKSKNILYLKKSKIKFSKLKKFDKIIKKHCEYIKEK